MKRLLSLLVMAGLLIAAVPGWRFLSMAATVAVGHAAKQACSGLFISQFPSGFATENYLYPGLAPMGPLLNWLELDIDREDRAVTAQLPGFSARAVYRGATGCTIGAPVQQIAATLPELVDAPALPVPDAALAAVIDRAFAEPAGGGRNTLAVLVRHRGEVIAERYRAPAGAATPLQGWSMNKSLMATWVGIRIAQGGLSLEQRVAPIVAHREPELAAQLAPELDLGHLLHMESGLDFEETYFPGDQATDMLYGSRPMWQVAPSRGHAYVPGQHFRYSSGDTNLASFIWQHSLAGEPYQHWIERYFARPLGIRSLVAEPDSSGVQVGSSYTYMTARDWSRVGQLWLDAWHGRSQLLSQAWLRAAVTPRRAAETRSYGRGFWLNSGVRAFEGLPPTLFYASGHSGQSVVVMPEQELIVVRLGLTLDDADSGLQELLQGVLQWVAAQPANPQRTF